jgi:hypothetical protein
MIPRPNKQFQNALQVSNLRDVVDGIGISYDMDSSTTRMNKISLFSFTELAWGVDRYREMKDRRVVIKTRQLKSILLALCIDLKSLISL